MAVAAVAVALVGGWTVLVRDLPDDGIEPTADDGSSPSPAATEDSTEADGAGGLDDMLDGLLGDAPSVAQLTRCLAGVTPGAGDGDQPADTAAAIAAIAEQVAADRGLQFTTPVDPVLLDASDLADRVRQLVEEDYTAEVADQDRRLLEAVGAVPAGVDLQALTTDLLGEQVAGFYDPDTGELVSLAGEEVDAASAIILAHEIDHALTDQALGIPDLDGFEGDADGALAALSLVEGDASLLMQRWSLQYQSLGDQLSAAATSAASSDVLTNAPQYLQQSLVFPYTVGLGFACELYAQGGWPAIDQAYADPPTTTAQVLWPDRYLDRQVAVDVTDPRVPDGYEPLRTDTFGAADLLWLFRAPGDDRARALSDPMDRASAWAGGEVALSGNGEDSAVGIVLADTGTSTTPLCDSVDAWYEAAFPDATRSSTGDDVTFAGGAQAALLRCDGTMVSLGIAPDVDTAAGTLPPP